MMRKVIAVLLSGYLVGCAGVFGGQQFELQFNEEQLQAAAEIGVTYGPIFQEMYLNYMERREQAEAEAEREYWQTRLDLLMQALEAIKTEVGSS